MFAGFPKKEEGAKKIFQWACIKGDIWLAKNINKKSKIENITHDYNKCFIDACIAGNLDLIKWLEKKISKNNAKEKINYELYPIVEYLNIMDKNNTANWLCEYHALSLSNNKPKSSNEIVLEFMCKNGYDEAIKNLCHILSEEEVRYGNDQIFRIACENNRTEIAMMLLEKYPQIMNTSDWNALFRIVCEKDNYEIANYLLNTKSINHHIDIRANNDYIFKYICENNFTALARLLLNFTSAYKIINWKAFSYEIKND